MIKSVTQLEKAVETLKASALLQGKSSSSTLAHVQGMMKTAVNMADAMGLVEQNSGLYAFMQQPVMDVPVADYSFHAGDIVGTVEKLLKAFRDKKVELETTEAKAVSDFERGRPRVSRAFHDFFSSLTRNDHYILNDCDTWQ